MLRHVVVFLAACTGPAITDDVVADEPAPLGLPWENDGVLYAGTAVIDVTPDIVETFTDLNGNADFDGCHDQPAGGTDDCSEPFDDANGNGWFDPVWIGGFGPLRPANGVHDPVYARALVLVRDQEILAFVTLDFVGLMFPRIHDARDALAADGFPADRLIVNSSHNHQGPDTMGLWGDPYDIANPITGLDHDYQATIALAIEQAVRDAADTVVPVDLTVGALHMRDRSALFNGTNWGGHSPDRIQRGMVHDGRDPVVVSDQLLAIQGADDGGDVVFTLTSWSGHPEVRGSRNNDLSADWVGVARDVIESHYGGTALHMPECLGGMQSALGGELPLVLEDGTHQWRTCDAAAVADIDDETCFGKIEGEIASWDDGVDEPVWAERDSWAFVTSHGWHIAEAAIAALDAGESMESTPIRVEVEEMAIPLQNIAYKLMGPSGMFEPDFDELIVDREICPEAADEDDCLPARTFRIQLGDVSFAGVPGELLPELAWGLPDDAQWLAEVDDPTARGGGSLYFPQHDHACDTVDFDEQCTTSVSAGDCDCLQAHAWPYRLADDPSLKPILSHMGTKYVAAISMTDNYLSYIIPEPDVNSGVSLLSDRDGDHYEDTVTPGSAFGTRVLRAHQAIADRWDP